MITGFSFLSELLHKQQKQTTIEFNRAPAHGYSKHSRSQRQSAVGLNYFLSLEISFIRAESNSDVWVRLRSQRIAEAMNVRQSNELFMARMNKPLYAGPDVRLFNPKHFPLLA